MKNTYTLISLLLSLSACVSHEELLNFSEGAPFPNAPVDIDNLPQLVIQPDDLLSIRVKTLDPLAAEPFNVDPTQGNMMNINAGAGTRPLIGYLVAHDGTIDFPVLGKLPVAGKTTDEVRQMLIDGLQAYVKDPVVIVRYLNFRITVLGEVAAPSTFFIANERVTVLDALGQAGDITPYGNRTNVLVIREQNGQRTFGRLDLQDRDLFRSPFFYLQQNDIIYIEPLKEKTAQVRDQSQRILPWLSVITSLTTLALTLANL